MRSIVVRVRWFILPPVLLFAGLAAAAFAPGSAPVISTPAHAAGGGAAELRIYVSLPRQGANATTSKLIVRGLRAAVAERDGQVAGRPLRLIQLDDATGPRWKPWRVRANARRAVADERAVAYIGELNSEATAIAEPILTGAQMTMFAPVSTATSLTDRLASGPRRPVLFRSIPTDAEQADALGIYLKRSGVRRFALIEDGALYGQGLAATVAAVARRRGIKLVAHRRASRNGRGNSALARSIAEKAPQAVLFAGSLSSGAVALFRALNRAMPEALLFGGDALAHDAFARQLGPIQPLVRLTAPEAMAQPRRAWELGLGRRPDAVTVFAYEGMRALLAALGRSGAVPAFGVDGDVHMIRRAVRDAVFDGHFNRGLIGPWWINPNGDSTLRAFNAIRLRGGRVLNRGLIVASRRAPKNPSK